MSEWQPIETAPKDGTVIRLYIPGHPELEGMQGRWDRFENEWQAYPLFGTLGRAKDVPDPIYWMPLYEPLSSLKTAKGNQP
jgi:hypothetical protein